MFRNKTTFVVGAGASKEIGLPLGFELKTQIAELLAPGDTNAYGFKDDMMARLVANRLGPDGIYKGDQVQAINAAAARIRSGLLTSPSIDNLLYTHDGDEEVAQLGKLGIAVSILKAEAMSHLYRLRSYRVGGTTTRELTIEQADLRKSWYYPLAERLFTLVPKHDIAAAFRNVQFVIFNYDRCLETFLHQVIQTHFSVDENVATEVLRSVSFVHPYGSLGLLPWQEGDAPSKIPLGQVDGVDYWRIAENIRTFTEVVDRGLQQSVRQMLAESNTIMFLGFGFLEQNERLLRPPATKAARQVFATVYGEHIDEHAILKTRLCGYLADPGSAQVFLERKECRDIFHHYNRHLEVA